MNELIVVPIPPAASSESTEQKPDEQPAPPSKPSPWRRYGVAACALALTLSAAWAAGTQIQSRQAAEAQGGEARALQKLAASNETERNDIRVLREELRALQARLDTVNRRRGAEEAEALEARISSLDRKVDANHADAAQLAAKLEKHEKSIERIEAAASDKSRVASIANNDAKPAAKAEAKAPVPATGGSNAKPADLKPADLKPPLSNFVLREVDNGVALVQGSGGLYEVSPGERLPGAGKVLAIEKIGRKWVVVTDRGRIDGQASSPRPRYSQRRDHGDYYPDDRF